MLSTRLFLLPLCAALCAACDRYVVTLNENEIHTPPPAFIEQVLSDPGLKKCVGKSFTRQGISRPDQLTALDCHNNSIQSLEGMDIFSQLTAIDLAGNQLQDLQPLLTLKQLKRVNLSDNPALDCEQVRYLAEQRVMVVHPQHCTL